MYAGTLAQLERPADDPVQSWCRPDDSRALDVRTTQHGLGDDRPVQHGYAAAEVETTETDVAVLGSDANPTVDVERRDTRERVATEWTADLTGTGVVAAESVHPAEPLPFPFGMFSARTGSDVVPLVVDVAELKDAWESDDRIRSLWLKGEKPAPDSDAAALAYNASADVDGQANIGVGFNLRWSGSVARGVVYESGYLALYSAETETAFMSFIRDEILEHSTAVDPSDDGDDDQTTLSDVSGWSE